MKFGEFVSTLKAPKYIQIRNKDGFELCRISSRSDFIDMFKDRVITLWFPVTGNNIIMNEELCGLDIVVYFGQED